MTLEHHRQNCPVLQRYNKSSDHTVFPEMQNQLSVHGFMATYARPPTCTNTANGSAAYRLEALSAFFLAALCATPCGFQSRQVLNAFYSYLFLVSVAMLSMGRMQKFVTSLKESRAMQLWLPQHCTTSSRTSNANKGMYGGGALLKNPWEFLHW